MQSYGPLRLERLRELLGKRRGLAIGIATLIPLLALVAFLLLSGEKAPAAGARPILLPPPPPAPVAPEEPTIARGIVAEESANVYLTPSLESRVTGLVRQGARFEVVESRDVGTLRFHRLKNAGWVLGTGVRVRTDGEPTIGFIPSQPRLDQPMPYSIARVTARDGVPVYRRPPRRGEDPTVVRMRDFREGYFFTVDKWVNIYDRQLHRGIRYWFVPREGTTPVVAPDFEGIPVTDRMTIPFLWVTDPTARVCTTPIAPNATCEPVERHSRLPLLGEHRDRGGVWYKTTDGRYIVSLQVAKVSRLTQFPSGLHQGERFIHVDLRNQFAALYEGDKMVFVTLISSGDDAHPTPPGTYRVESKHVTATMDDEENLNGAYFIQDVPWVLYFKGGYALHAAFWHNRFGLKTSHGCVNLAPRDAHRFFQFAQAPALPQGLHAVFAPPDHPGTLVHITN
jgi:hypothetical protein